MSIFILYFHNHFNSYPPMAHWSPDLHIQLTRAAPRSAPRDAPQIPDKPSETQGKLVDRLGDQTELLTILGFWMFLDVFRTISPIGQNQTTDNHRLLFKFLPLNVFASSAFWSTWSFGCVRGAMMIIGYSMWIYVDDVDTVWRCRTFQILEKWKLLNTRSGSFCCFASSSHLQPKKLFDRGIAW